MERGLSKTQILKELLKSPHGKLETYVPAIAEAAQSDPDFTAHLVSYNALRGEIIDAHVALPVVTLSVPEFKDAFIRCGRMVNDAGGPNICF